MFDVIMLDAYVTGKEALVQAVNTVPFYNQCRNRLTDDGVLAVNLCKQIDPLKFLLDVVFKGRTKTVTTPFADNQIQLCFRKPVQSIANLSLDKG